MKNLLIFILIFANTMCFAVPPKRVVQSFDKLTDPDDNVRQKSAYRLKGYYTDNGAIPTKEEIDLLRKNSEILLRALSDNDQEVRYYVTELLASRFIDQYPSPPLLFLTLVTDKKYKQYKRKILVNIGHKYENLSESSIIAMINMKECSLASKMEAIVINWKSDYRIRKMKNTIQRFKDSCGGMNS